MTPYDPQRHHRRSIRLKGYDYTHPGAYFVTLVTKERECLFGEIVDGEMRLNEVGKIAHQEWLRLARRFTNIRLDAFVIMPNHIHAIMVITDVNERETTRDVWATRHDHTSTDQARNGSPRPPDRPHGPQSGSLGAFIGQFKSRVTKRLRLTGNIWQRNYYEHIIRDETEYARIVAYIQANPQRWIGDQIHPAID